jgi:tryptophan-rich sensory protein
MQGLLKPLDMENYSWYQTLIKPSWAPPSWLFGPVWTVLYIIIAVSFGYVFYQTAKKRLRLKTAVPFALNLSFNLAFTPIQFGLRNNLLAFTDIILVLITLLWSLWSVRKTYVWVMTINIPYLLWVSFATILQLSVTLLNL